MILPPRLVIPLAAGGAAALLLTASCIPVGATNPRFDISGEEIWNEFERMQGKPVDLERPVLVVGPYHGPDPLIRQLQRRLIDLTSGDPHDFAYVTTWFDTTIPTVVERTIETAGERFGLSEDGTETAEVDVVGVSMGGVIARAAAIEREGRPRLKIRNLYTMASPHRGANLAKRIAPDDAAKDLRPGSVFIGWLEEHDNQRDYDLIAYGVLNDGVVGVLNSAPPGETPLWTRGKLWGSHVMVMENKPITADIARRLRGEPPIAEPGQPLPAYH